MPFDCTGKCRRRDLRDGDLSQLVGGKPICTECEPNRVIPAHVEPQTLVLDLDEFAQDGYFYTEFDIGGAGHSITILAENREKFLDAYVAETRKRVEKMLRPTSRGD